MDSLPLSNLSPLQQCDGSNAEWLKPFEEGWQREIVLRNTNLSGSPKKLDVYYYTPDNKKLRSFPEIEAFLRTTEGSLSINCFTFKKERIHADPSEIVRQAAPNRGRNRGVAGSTTIDDSSTNASVSITASGSSSAVAEEASLEIRELSVAVNAENGSDSCADRKRRRTDTSVNSLTEEPVTKKAQMPDDQCAKYCSVYCFGRKWPTWPLDVFCRTCGYGFHFVCIGKSSFTSDYICMECSPKAEPDDCSTSSENKDVTQSTTSFVPNNCEESDCPEVVSSTSEKPQTLQNKSFPCIYSSRTSECQHLFKNAFCLGSLPTSRSVCSLDNERLVLFGNGVQIKPTEDKAKKEILKKDKRRRIFADSDVNYFRMVYDSLERIFKCLAVADLLNCRLVCKTWENIASQSSLWKNRFCNFPDKLKNLISRRESTSPEKNVHKCNSPDNVNAFARIPHLNRVNLGSCQCTVVEIVIDGSRDMRLFSAELFVDKRKDVAESQWPGDVVLDMKIFSGMARLEILRLRGIGRLIPMDLDQLSQLKSLGTLSLTSLYQVPGSNLSSIFTLPRLKVLELGDCYQWDQEVFKKLGDLQHLEILRLEVRHEEDDSGFGAALLRLKNLKRLELSRYTVGFELANILPKLTQLYHMYIWTELLDDKLKAARIFKNLLTGLQQMTFLQSLYLGVIAPAAKDGLDWNLNIPILSENGSDSEPTDVHHMYSQLQCKLKTTTIMLQTIPLYRLLKKAAT